MAAVDTTGMSAENQEMARIMAQSRKDTNDALLIQNENSQETTRKKAKADGLNYNYKQQLIR